MKAWGRNQYDGRHCCRWNHPCTCLVSHSAAGGLAALGAVNLTGLLTGVALPLNLFSLLVCCLLGAPGVITMLLLRLFWI